MNLCVFTRFQGIFGEISFDSYDEIEEGELVEVEKEGGETKKKKRKGNKEDRRRQADDSWMAGAISNGIVNLEERDPSWAPVRSPEAAFLDITNTGEGPSFLSDHTQVVSTVPSSFNTPVASSHGYIWCSTPLKIVFSNFRLVEIFSRMGLLQNQWKHLKD